MSQCGRPDWVVCAEKYPETTWCGGRLMGGMFRFTGLDHALLNAEQGGRLTLCPECKAAALAILTGIPRGQNTHAPADLSPLKD